jgi:catechol-2,3-dioxygenase
MALHGLARLTLGVPDVAAAAQYYQDFGLSPLGEGRFATVHGGHQLTLTQAPLRRLLELRIRADSREDLERIEASLKRFGAPARWEGELLVTAEPKSGSRIALEVLPRLLQPAAPALLTNGPGYANRPNVRLHAFDRTEPVRPSKLGHVVLGSTDWQYTGRFFMEGLGFRESDTVRNVGVFMRCSQDHHNVFVLNFKADFMHHTGWEVDDVDEVGRGAANMVRRHPDTHTWGLGRHYVGSNFFWYLKDPAGNFAEYYSDMDHIDDDAKWAVGLQKTGLGWGLAPPPRITDPQDLAAFLG